MEFNVMSYGAVGDGTADDRAAIQQAVDAAKPTGGTISFPAGKYQLSGPVVVSGAHDLRFLGEHLPALQREARVLFLSDRPLPQEVVQRDPRPHRAAFYVENSERIIFDRLAGQGSQTANFDVNGGAFVFASNTRDLTVMHCRSDFGGSILQQDLLTNDHGARLLYSYSFGARSNVTVGKDALISDCIFELPREKGYDRIGHQSSAAIYIFAGRENITITRNIFRNMRTNGVQVSGTSDPIRHILITENLFDDCGGGIVAGSDKTNDKDHRDITIRGNLFFDVGTNRPGWHFTAPIEIQGAQSVLVEDNRIEYSHEDLNGHAGAAISVGRVVTDRNTGLPVDDVRVVGNSIRLARKLDGAIVPQPEKVITSGIKIARVGEGLEQPVGIVMARNVIDGVGAYGIAAEQSFGVKIEENEFSDVITAIQMVGNHAPVVRNNRLVVGPNTSRNPQIRSNSDIDPVIEGNTTIARGIDGEERFTVSFSG